MTTMEVDHKVKSQDLLVQAVIVWFVAVPFFVVLLVASVAEFAGVWPLDIGRSIAMAVLVGGFGVSTLVAVSWGVSVTRCYLKSLSSR